MEGFSRCRRVSEDFLPTVPSLKEGEGSKRSVSDDESAVDVSSP